jgi:hypothetical protein
VQAINGLLRNQLAMAAAGSSNASMPTKKAGAKPAFSD